MDHHFERQERTRQLERWPKKCCFVLKSNYAVTLSGYHDIFSLAMCILILFLLKIDEKSRFSTVSLIILFCFLPQVAFWFVMKI